MTDKFSLGTKIRQERKQKGLLLSDLAERCGISSSFISQIERDMASPSISTLHTLAEALGVPLAHFFGESQPAAQIEVEPQPEARPISHDVHVVRSTHRKILIYPGSGIKNELLSPDLNHAIQMMWVVIPPGKETGPEPLVHEGEECGLILQGTVRIWVGEEEYVLGPGDSIYQNSSIPHRSRNIGQDDVIVVTAITPPSF